MKAGRMRQLEEVECDDFKSPSINAFELHLDGKRDYGLQLAQRAIEALKAEFKIKKLPGKAGEIFETL
jgi:hypothetical protein